MGIASYYQVLNFQTSLVDADAYNFNDSFEKGMRVMTYDVCR